MWTEYVYMALLDSTHHSVQIAKLMIVPFVCLVEWSWMGKRFNFGRILSVLAAVVGVAVV